MAVTIIQSAVAEVIGGMPVSMAASKYGLALSTIYSHLPNDPQHKAERRRNAYAAYPLDSLSKAQQGKAIAAKEDAQAEAVLRRRARNVVRQAGQELWKKTVDMAAEALAAGYSERQVLTLLKGGDRG